MTERRTLSLERRLAWLVPQHGALEGQVFPIADGDTIGAGDRVHLQVRGYPAVAPVHARLVAAATWTLHDLGVAPTRIGGRALPPGGAGPVHDGDPIELGSLRMIFKCL